MYSEWDMLSDKLHLLGIVQLVKGLSVVAKMEVD